MAARRQVAGDGVDAEAADGEQRRQPGAVLGDEGSDGALEPVLGLGAEQHPGRAHTDQPEEDAPTDRRALALPGFVRRWLWRWLVHHMKGTEPEADRIIGPLSSALDMGYQGGGDDERGRTR